MKPRASHRLPWWAVATQWFALFCLTASAIANAVTDQGTLMAINCFCLGFIWFSMVFGRLIDHRIERLDAVMADMEAAEAEAIAMSRRFERALQDGSIEVVPITPDQPTTLH